MADMKRYKQHDRLNDEKKIDSMGKILPPDELNNSFVFRFEGYDQDGAYFSRMHNGAMYYFDFLAKVPLINVRRREAQHYWQVPTLERGIEQMQEDYENWQQKMKKDEAAQKFAPPPDDVNDIPF